MERLSDLTRDLKIQSARITPGRFIQCLAIGGSERGALAFAEKQHHWNDRVQIVPAIKSLVGGMGTADFASAITPVADAFLAAMRPFSVPLRLSGLRRTPMLTRIFINTAGVVAAQVVEGQAIPVLKGTWATATLTPKKFAGIVVQTEELVRSTEAVASAGITADLAEATAEAENAAFVSPDVSGSVLQGAPTFGGTGATVAAVDADLKRLVDLVPGAFRPGAAFVMTKESATFLSLLRGSGGAAAYPLVTPQGGSLLGLPVLITSACLLSGSPTARIIGLLSPGEIFWADDGKVILSVSNQAALQMDGAPTNNSLTGTATAQVSMFQSSSFATKAVRESAWNARTGSGAYFAAAF